MNLTIKGKTFNPEKKIDPTRHLGKAVFADYVDNHAGTIDFSGFVGTLGRITAAIEAHANRNAQPQPVHL